MLLEIYGCHFGRMLQDEFMFDYPEALEKIDSLSQSDVKDLRDNFLKNISIDCSIMGNVIEQQSAEYAEILKNKLLTGAGQCFSRKARPLLTLLVIL